MVTRLRPGYRRSMLPSRTQEGLRSFKIERQHDQSGVSGTGVVLEGVVFSTGVTVIHWLTPMPGGSVTIWQTFEQFMSVHVGSHPENRTRVHWDDGETWEPGDWVQNPTPFSS